MTKPKHEFSYDDSVNYEAILYPDGTRAFFLVPSGFGMPSKTIKLANHVINHLNSLSPEEISKILGE